MNAFLRGIARIFDLFGVYDPPLNLGSLEDDQRTLFNDQLIVLRDAYNAIYQPEKHNELDRS